ncbi:MAG: AmmeMemoRadiSam system protein B [Candidatus Undinarchaeales archaeon]
MIRTPAVAGTFYPLNKEQLEESIKKSFEKETGPGMPGKKEDKNFISGVAPHAGYAYSGSVAAYLYKEVAESNKIDNFIILGPSHTGLGAPISIMKEGAWAMPFGQVEINQELAEKIIQKEEHFSAGDMAHFKEHSIEVQLPFLQFIQDDFKIVPVCMGMQDYDISKKIGKVIASVSDKKTAVIASSDLLHYQPPQIVKKKDLENLKPLKKLDTKKFYEKTMKEKGACGVGPIVASAEFAKEKGAKKAEILKHATSGDATGDKSSVVGYASILFK